MKIVYLANKKIMSIEIRNKRCKKENILKEFPDAVIIDVTSKGEGEWQRLSPFYPHGGIPVPFSEGVTSQSVEGVWQGLKVFENGTDIDRSCFYNSTMKGLKRTCRTNGRMRGHRKGVKGTEFLEYIEARKLIYRPTYYWMLEHRCSEQIKKIRIIAKTRTVVLLDYDTNADIEDWRKPLSHASLIKSFIEEQPQQPTSAPE